MGHEKLVHQISACPLLTRHQVLQTRMESPSRLLQQRASRVTLKVVQDANSAANPAKTAAVSNGNAGSFMLMTSGRRDRLPKLQRTKRASCSTTTRAFLWHANGKYMLDFKCAHSAVGIALLR